MKQHYRTLLRRLIYESCCLATYGIYEPSIPNSTKLITEQFGMYSTSGYSLESKICQSITLLETKWKNKKLPEISWNSLPINKSQKEGEINIRQYDQEHHVIQAALAGQGVALVSALLVKNALHQGWLQPYKIADIEQELEGSSYYILVPEHNIRSKSIFAFKSWLMNELG